MWFMTRLHPLMDNYMRTSIECANLTGAKKSYVECTGVNCFCRPLMSCFNFHSERE